jgi:non-canonical (house-cleaning) NTP pyrophosphatase
MDNSNLVTLRVAVGTTNPCKVKAVEEALRRSVVQNNENLQLTFQVEGYNVDSGVSNQPWNDEETKRGAMNRARNAYFYNKCHEDLDSDDGHGPSPHIAVGIEGGLEWENNKDQSTSALPQQDQLYCMAWVAIYGEQTPFVAKFFDASISGCGNVNGGNSTAVNDLKASFGLSKTAMFRLPPSLAALIKQGMELGHADDMLFGRTNSKHTSGTVGLLTNSRIDRSAFYEHAIILALIPWMKATLYPDGSAEFPQCG